MRSSVFFVRRKALVVATTAALAVTGSWAAAGADPSFDVAYRGVIAPTSVDDRIGTSVGLAFLADGTLLSLTADRQLNAYSAEGVYLGEIPVPAEIERPIALAPLGDRFAIASLDGPVFVLAPDGTVERRLGGDLDPPLRSHMIASGGGRLYVLDRSIQAVRVLGPDGREEERIGEGRIGRAVGLAAGPDRVAVTDQSAYKVRAFGPDGRVLLEFGRAGGTEGKFSFISGLALDVEGRFWVIDSTKQLVQVFDPTGAFLRGVPVPSPCAIAARGGRVYVASASLPGIVVFEA